MNKHELISALADGQLRGDEFARTVEAIAGDPAALETWQAYHLIGDVLRSGGPVAGTATPAFVGRLSRRLAQEPPYAIDSIAAGALPVRATGHLDTKMAAMRPAANDASFRWKLVAGFASLAAVAAIGWVAVGSFGGAASQGAVLAGGERGVMIRDPQLDEMLAAHRQLSGSSALQMPAGVLRNATFEGPAR